MKNLVNKTINLSLLGEECDRYYLLGAFIEQARQEQWTFDEVIRVTNEAQKGDFDHFLEVLNTHCSPKDGE